MKRIKFFLIALVFAPFCAHAAQNDFMVAAQLLSAAKNADIQQVQILVNSGADVNFVDATGLSLVCTALMNNDLRAAQILQMYGADASKCDKQIKNYKSKNKKEGGGGLFSGLSTAQGIALAAAGAAVVVGGLLLLTDVFDGGNSNGSGGGSTGDRPGGGGSGNGGNKPTPSFTLPYGPAMPDAASEATNYKNNLDIYSTKGDEEQGTIFYQDFQLMNQLQAVGDDTKTGGQNYLLMMHGYSPWARGYLGQRTLRQSDGTPFNLSDYKLNNDQVGGGLPVNVVLVTENGVNSAATDTSLKDKIGLYTTQNGQSLNQASKEMIFSKYYNNKITCNGSNGISDCTGAEDSSQISQFDLSGMGSANQNPMATDFDDLLGKIVGGNNSGTTKADYAGFMPNGQMTIYRTGGGWGLVAVGDDGEKKSGSYNMTGESFAENDTITINDGDTYTIKDVNQNGVFTAQKDGAGTYVGYVIGQNLYMDTDGDGKIDMAFTMTNNGEKKLTQTMKGQVIDYQNYKALSSALSLNDSTNGSTGAKSKPDVLANIYVIEPLHATNAATINDILSVKSDSSDDNRKSAFAKYVDAYYDLTPSENNNNVSSDATKFFNSLGSQNHQLVLFSTGASLTDTCNAAGENCTNPLGEHWGGAALDATFENAAPLVFDNLEHLFMSIVAVGLSGVGTSNATSVSGFTPESASKYVLAQWGVKGTDDIKYYRARKCGVAGMGLNGIDPWCFAATGFTDEIAMASAAGAVGVMKSAFPNFDNTRLFILLALTADGPFLATNTDGNAFSSVDALEAYLKNLFQMPNEDEARWQNGDADYLEVFQSVFGYGLINLERATTPGTSVYFYNGTDIVSGSGNAYWRAAANTVFRTSAVFNPRGGSISAPYYDILESVDGELRLPRVWENEFKLGTQSRRGLYMGDVLGELRTRVATPNRMMIGDIGFSMAMSAKPYADNLGGLDSMQIDYAYGNWNFNAGYQHYLTDGESRFNAMSNPILGLASNAITSDSEYRMGRFAFGARMFSGAITDESLLENDPTIVAQFEPMRLGNMYGAQSYVAWDNGKFGFSAAVGNARETNTLLGAMTGGLLDLGNGNTVYVDSELRWAPIENVNLRMRSTFARTTSDASGQFIMGLTPIESNAFALGVDVGAFGFTAAMPLAITSGAMKYAYADYDVVEVSSGKYDLVVRDARVAQLGLTPVARELRFTGTYRHKLGEFTDGAIGFIYRVNPNNTNEFGNESIFMMKLSHRIGI